MSLLRSWLVVVAMLVGASDAAADTEWIVLEGRGLFRVEFPYKPLCTQYDGKNGDGVTIVYQLCMTEKDGLTLSIQTALFPPGNNLRPSLMRAAETRAKELVGEKWGTLATTLYQGHESVEAVGIGKDGAINRLRSIAVGTRLYILAGMALTGRASTSDLDRFFASLQLQ